MQQPHIQATAPAGIFADSPDFLDDLDIDHLVSAHQQQAAKPQLVGDTVLAAHAACSITQASQRPAETKPASHSLSLLGAGGSGSGAYTHSVAATGAAQLPSARAPATDAQHASAVPRAPALAHRPGQLVTPSFAAPAVTQAFADVQQASAAPRALARAHGAAQLSSSSYTAPVAQSRLSDPHAEPCSHGMPMEQCRHKQDHLNHVNADLVKILLGERTAAPGEQDRLKGLKKLIEECMAREASCGSQGLDQQSTVPAAAVQDFRPPGRQKQYSMVPVPRGALDAGRFSLLKKSHACL